MEVKKNENEYANSYVSFMLNPENAKKCDDCPENIGSSSWQGNLPCGQQNCWVTLHCESAGITSD